MKLIIRAPELTLELIQELVEGIKVLDKNSGRDSRRREILDVGRPEIHFETTLNRFENTLDLRNIINLQYD